MGIIRPALPVKLFIGIITGNQDLLPDVEPALTAEFGPVDLRSAVYPFDFTAYYEDEMGAGLVRQFLGFERLIAPHFLPAAKLFTNDLEARVVQHGPPVRRPVNLDPGYLEQGKIVLASTKNYYHRICLADGIFAEVTLCFKDKQWHSFPWTFPDYRSSRYDDFFHALRRTYRAQLKRGVDEERRRQ